MNNNYYENPIIPNYGKEIIQNGEHNYRNNNIYSTDDIFIDNIIKYNRGKKAKIFATIPYSSEWQDKEFEGIIESSGKDHIIISNPSTGEWTIIPIMYISYITLEEPINYNYLQ